MIKVDVLQVFISTSAIFGIGLIWIKFNEKVFKTVRRLAAAPFSWPKKEDDSLSSDEEEGYWHCVKQRVSWSGNHTIRTRIL